MKKTFLIFSLIIPLLTGIVYAAPTSVDRQSGYIQPLINTDTIRIPSLPSINCLGTDSLGKIQNGTCSGGSGGGTWSTTTSSVSGKLVNYPNNTTDIPCIGGTATTTCKWWFDPNTSTFKSLDITMGGPWVDARYYTSFATAISSIGTATTTLLVPNTQNITSNLTVPVNVTLKFISNGMLNPSNGVTVTILGQIDAPFRKIFNNSINYVATTSFSGNVVQGKYMTAWWGTPNDWTNDATPYLQAAINAMPLFSTLYYPNGQKMLLNSTLNFDQKANVTFTSDEQPNTVTPNYGIKWNGPNGAPMVTMYRTASSRIVNHTFIASTTSTAAGKIIDIDRDSGPGYTTTDNWIVGNMMPTNPASSTFKAISISETAVSNNEFMNIIGNKVTGAGTFQGVGLYMGASSNAHGHVVNGNTFYDFQYGIHSVNGSFNISTFGNFGGNDYDLYVENVSYPSVARYIDSENSRHFAYINGNTYPVKIEYSRIMGPGYAGDGFIIFGPLAKHVSFEGNIIGGDSSTYTYDASGANNLRLTSTNNRFASSPAKTEANNYHGFYPPLQGAILTRNDPGYYNATSTTWANQQIVRDVTLSYPSPGLNAGDIHLSPSLGGHVSGNSNSITFGANSNSYYDQAVAGIYVQTTQSPTTNSTMYFGTTNSYTAGPQIRMTISPTGNIGIGTTSPYAKLSVVGQVVAPYFTATTTTASTFPYASTTALSGSALCIGTDCRTAWPTSGSGVWPFTTTDTNYGVAVQSTTTPEWFKNGFMASSTSYLTYASTTALTVSGTASTTALVVSNLAGASSRCVEAGTDGTLTVTASACGTGGGGAGAFSTTTSSDPTKLIVYPNNSTDIVNIGSNSTTTGSFWFDPNRQVGYAKRFGINNTNPSATYALDITGQLRTTQVATLNELNLGAGWAYWVQGATGGIGLGSGHNIAWKSSTTNTGNTGDVGLSRYGAGVLAVGNGTAGNASSTLIAGSIGVGTTSPYAMLSVAGQVVGQYFTATSTSQASTFPYASTTVLSVSDSLFSNNKSYFNVANNCTSPAIAGNTDTDTGVDWNGSNILSLCAGGNRMLRIDGGAGNTMTFNSATIDTDVLFNTSGGRGIVIDGGNTRVGINTSATAANIKNSLDVNGAIAIGSSYAETNTAPTNGLLVQGDVGIGTSTPYAKLSVVGEVAARNFTATSTTLNTFPYASSTAISSGYASSTVLMTTGHQVYSTYDKSLWAASSTLDARYNSFNTATSSWIVWNPSIATAAQNVYCKTDVGTATLQMGNGTASTTAICSSSGVEVTSSVTWSARQDVMFAIKTTSGSPNKVTATGTFYAQ